MSSVTVIDPMKDTNHSELARLVRLYDFPSFVKQAELGDTLHPSTVAVTTFADPRNRQFPCHSAAATWLSGLYFHEKKAEYHPKDRDAIQKRLEHYVSYFRIKPAYDQMVASVDEMNKEAELPDSSYAYVWVAEDGKKDRHLPMTSAQTTKAAAEWLYKFKERLPFADRHACSKKILEKAAHFGTAMGEGLTDYLEKQAGMGVCDPAEVVDMILQRSRLTKSAAHKEQIERMAATVRDQPQFALNPDNLVKLAEAMDTTDRALNLHDKYGAIIKSPEEVIFKVTFTKAAADRAECCAMTTGNVWTQEQLSKVGRDDLESLFGTDFVKAVSDGMTVNTEKLAEIAHTLPRPDAELFDSMMAECGVQPTMQKAASDVNRLSQEALAELAKLY